MDAIKTTEPREDSRRQTESYRNLDARYGKIGISAVAAAVCHQREQRIARGQHNASAFDAD